MPKYLELVKGPNPFGSWAPNPLLYHFGFLA